MGLCLWIFEVFVIDLLLCRVAGFGVGVATCFSSCADTWVTVLHLFQKRLRVLVIQILFHLACTDVVSTWRAWKPDTRWFKYYRDDLCVNKSQFVPVMFEPPCTLTKRWQMLLDNNTGSGVVMLWPIRTRHVEVWTSPGLLNNHSLSSSPISTVFAMSVYVCMNSFPIGNWNIWNLCWNLLISFHVEFHTCAHAHAS